MTFHIAFGAAKNVYLFAGGAGGASSGWQARGTWTVPKYLRVVTRAPLRGRRPRASVALLSLRA